MHLDNRLTSIFAGMVAGMYAGFEYGMEKARGGKHDWVRNNLPPALNDAASHQHCFIWLTAWFADPLFIMTVETRIALSPSFKSPLGGELKESDVLRETCLDNHILEFSTPSRSRGLWKTLIFRKRACIITCSLIYCRWSIFAEKCSTWRCIDRSHSLRLRWQGQPR